MGRVAGDGQHLGARLAQADRHLGQHRASLVIAVVTVGNLGVDVDQHPQVILLAADRRGRLQLGQEIQGGGGAHAAEDAEGFRHLSLIPQSVVIPGGAKRRPGTDA
ncbi:hypothetical protein D3C87_1869060 [compost metagenome]